MAIELVGGSVSDTNVTSVPLNSGLSGGIASGVRAGDLVLCCFGQSSTADRALTITDGTNDYTLVGSELYADDTSADTNLRVAYKFMGDAPDTTLTVTAGATGDGTIAGIMVFSGVDPATPIDMTPTTATGINTVLANPPSITPVTRGSWIVGIGCGAWAASGAGLFSSSDLTDFFSNDANSTRDCTMGIGLKKDWASGSFDPAAYTFSGTDGTAYSWAAMSVALRPKRSLVFNPQPLRPILVR